MKKVFGAVLVLAMLAIVLGCDARQKAQEQARGMRSSNDVKMIVLDLHNQFDQTKKWPETVDLSGKTNPLTGDTPGYEYVAPTEFNESGYPVDTENTVVIYQLRNGQRDTSLPVGYANGSVRLLGSE